MNVSRRSPPVVQAESKIRRPTAENEKLGAPRYHAAVEEQQSKDILYLLITLRFLNALCVQTFFQPDEYFQSLEPAWQMAFGQDSGAWITWEWQHQLRSSLHPALFAGLYYVADTLMKSLSMYPQFRAMILVYLPKILQGVVAAFGDYYTWKLAEKVYGRGSNYAWTALFATMFNPWQWFCSTRTLSNSLETSLTVAALYYWPWQMYDDAEAVSRGRAVPKTSPKPRWAMVGTSNVFQSLQDMAHFRWSLFFAGIACLLRPTNLLIWVSIVALSVSHLGLRGKSNVSAGDVILMVREAALCGSAALSISVVSDRLYFDFWAFPPYQWLNFNISQDLAVFYGQNRPDYYITEGLPLLLTTFLPFAIIGLVKSTNLSSGFDIRTSNIRFQFAFSILTTIATLSLISHKEVRFIYPLLPLLHVLLAPHLSNFFQLRDIPAPAVAGLKNLPAKPQRLTPPWRRALLGLLVLANIGIGMYTTLVHQRGVLDVLSFLRTEYENKHLSSRGVPLADVDHEGAFAAFLMPCHSTPWRSHLVYSDLNAWALTCEPPLHIPAGTPERKVYRDEADRFFDDPERFLQEEVGGRDRPWPRYVVGFEGEKDLEQVLKEYMETKMGGLTIKRKWEGFNSHWHDDSRRTGKVVVWETAPLIDVSRWYHPDGTPRNND